MDVAIANARDQHVFRRNFGSNKWENLASQGKCRVQVVKKSSGDFVLKVFPDKGQVRRIRNLHGMG